MSLETMLTLLETVRLDETPCHTSSWPLFVVFERCAQLFLDFYDEKGGLEPRDRG